MNELTIGSSGQLLEIEKDLPIWIYCESKKLKQAVDQATSMYDKLHELKYCTIIDTWCGKVRDEKLFFCTIKAMGNETVKINY